MQELEEKGVSLESIDIVKSWYLSHLTFENSVRGNFVLNSYFEIIHHNSGFANMFGYEGMDLVGHYLDEFIPFDMRDRHRQLV